MNFTSFPCFYVFVEDGGNRVGRFIDKPKKRGFLKTDLTNFSKDKKYKKNRRNKKMFEIR